VTSLLLLLFVSAGVRAALALNVLRLPAPTRPSGQALGANRHPVPLLTDPALHVVNELTFTTRLSISYNAGMILSRWGAFQDGGELPPD